MSDIQDSILRLNFSQALPKSIIDKLSSHDLNRDGKIKGGGGKSAGKSEQGDSDKQDLVYDNDKKHVSWCLKDNENFMTMFYKNQKDCPKTFEGRHLCMKFFIRGLCTINLAHVLTTYRRRMRKKSRHICSPLQGASK